MPHWLSDWLQDHPTAVAVLAPAGAALCSVGLRYATNRWWGAQNYGVNNYFDKSPSNFYYVPDLDEPAFGQNLHMFRNRRTADPEIFRNGV